MQRAIYGRRLWWLLAALLVLMLGLLVIDGKPSVFMGDSASYLSTALHGYIPHDRSFVYGLLLRPLAVWPHSLRFLVFAQATMSAISAWLIAVILTGAFSVPFRWAAVLSFLCAIEPLQLILERYVLTDSIALFLFAVLATIAISFCRNRTKTRMALALTVGVVLISIRISYLPIVLLNSVVLPFLWIRKTRRASVALFLVWAGAGQLLLYGYRYLNATVSKMETPEYFYMDGFILISEVAPIVTAADFPAGIPGGAILSSVGVPLSDPVYREAQLFRPDGLCAVIRQVVPDEYQSNKLAKRVALHTILTHPVPFIRLAAHTWTEYFHISTLRAFLGVDEGGLRSTDGPFREEILTSLNTDLASSTTTGPVWRWHRAAIPWYWFLMAAPLAIPFVFLNAWRRIDAPTALVHLYLFVLLAQTVFFSTHAVPRYLTPFAWLAFLSIGIISCHLLQHRPDDSGGRHLSSRS